MVYGFRVQVRGSESRVSGLGFCRLALGLLVVGAEEAALARLARRPVHRRPAAARPLSSPNNLRLTTFGAMEFSTSMLSGTTSHPPPTRRHMRPWVGGVRIIKLTDTTAVRQEEIFTFTSMTQSCRNFFAHTQLIIAFSINQ